MSRNSTLRFGWYFLASFAVAIVAEPVVTAGADQTAAHRASRAGEQKVQQAMQKKIKAQWKDVPVAAVLKSIAKEAAVNLWIDESSLSEEGVPTDTPVVLDLGETSIWTAMTFITEPLGLGWHERNGVLEITTQAKADEQLTTRIYDVSALVKVIEPELQSLERRRQWHKGWHGFGMGMGGGGFFNVSTDEQGEQGLDRTRFLHAQFGGHGPLGGWGYGGVAGAHQIVSRIPQAETILADILQQVCWRAKWMNIDQEGGTLTAVRGRLIIRQTYGTHHQIQSLLQTLDSFLVQGVKAKSLAVQRPGYPMEEDAAIHERLAAPATLKAIASQELDSVIQEIAQKNLLRYWIDRSALNDEGIETDKPVSVSQHSDIPLNVILEHLLDPIGLTTAVREGVLVVTPQAKAEELESIIVYDTSGITGLSPDELQSAIVEGTSGRWMDIDQEGGKLENFGPRLVVVRQTQRIHSQIAALLEELREGSKPNAEPAKAELVQRIYPVSDGAAIDDLLKSLPKVTPGWDAESGWAIRLGECLMIKQPETAHERVSEIIGALNTAHSILHPKPAAPATAPAKIGAKEQ